jgi:hypothetical protein
LRQTPGISVLVWMIDSTQIFLVRSEINASHKSISRY